MAGFLTDELEDGMPPPPDDIGFGDDTVGGDSSGEPATDPRAVQVDDNGPLLKLKPAQAAKFAIKLWVAQDRTMNRRKTRWRANFLRRLGVQGVRLFRPDIDRNEWSMWAPAGASRTPPSVNKAARLCRRVEDNLFSDPAIPEAEPENESDEARAAAEFATRVLTQESSEAGLDLQRLARESFSKASTYGSGFRRYWVDPNGGGHRSRELLASKNATEVGNGEDDPLKDPTTGMQDPNPIIRYVAHDGRTITDDAGKAQLIWVEKLKAEVLTGHHVRLIPETVNGIGDADGAMVAAFLQYAHVKARFPDAIKKLKPDQIRTMGKFRPERWRDLLPDWMIDAPTGTKTPGDDDQNADADPIPDDAFVFVLTLYYRATPQYPMGCYFVLGGDSQVLHRDTWIGEDADGKVEPLDIPIDQCRQFMEGHDDPYGTCLMDLLGGQNEIRNAQWASWIEHLDRFNQRKWFLPITSILQPKQMQQTTGTYLYVNPGGIPVAEDVPDYPKASIELLNLTTEEMNDESGLQQAAQGLETPEITSGVQANYTVEQANKALSEVHQNAMSMHVRGWRIMQQQIRCFYTTPRKLRFLGEDNGWKEKEWTGSDLGSTRDVAIQEGSFTMQTPSQKATVANQYAQAGLLTHDQYQDVIRTQIQPLLALKDDPHLLRVRRQITTWKDGPSDELKQQAAAAQAVQPPSGQPGTPPVPGAAPGPLPMGGQPAPDPLLQAASQIFARLAIDVEPQIAQIRHNELARTMASGAFTKQPASWQTAYVNEYQAMRQAAGVMTLTEQSQSQQNQMHQQILLKEIPTIVEKATVDATNVMQTTQAAMAGYQPPQPGQPQPGQPPQQQQPPQAPAARPGQPLVPPMPRPPQQLPQLS